MITSLGRGQSHSCEQDASPYKEQDNSHLEWPDHTDNTIYFSKIAERKKVDSRVKGVSSNPGNGLTNLSQ